MTAAEAKSKVVQTANAEIGYKEGADNWNKYAAEIDPLKVTYGNKQNQPWCGMFVIWDFYKCFGISKALAMMCSPIPTCIPLCRDAAQYFKNANRWYSKPEIGDIIFFFYSGAINHTGIVTGVSGNTVTTVEGNSSDMVVRRSYNINGNSIIAGFGRPKWDLVSNVADTTPTTPTTTPTTTTAKVSGLPVLKRGDRSKAVKAAQILLIGWGCGCGPDGADGDFGGNTEAAVRRFQAEHGLAADGIIGERTWAALLGVS